MPIQIIHLSDLHYCDEWDEENEIVLEVLFEDLRGRITDSKNTYFLFSGDIIKAGANKKDFEKFVDKFGKFLTKNKINKNRRICVPGNHDTSQDAINSSQIVLEALSERDDNEKEFNDEIYNEFKVTVLPKFSNYFATIASFSKMTCTAKHYAGLGHKISDKIGVYTLNSALYSFGGVKSSNGFAINDQGKLRTETRNLHKWINESNFDYRILVMHHPTSWLVPWAKTELDTIISTSFDIVMCGHVHIADAEYRCSGTKDSITLVSPALHTRKDDELGYTILNLDEERSRLKITYRQWSNKSRNFVTGTIFSGTDDGTLFYDLSRSAISVDDTTEPARVDSDFVLSRLTNKFNSALETYTSLPPIWVIPDIADASESDHSKPNILIHSADKLLNGVNDLIIKAPPQFGLTSLRRFLCLEAWKRNHGQFYLYIDSIDFPNYELAIKKRIVRDLGEYDLEIHQLSAIVLDKTEMVSKKEIRKINNIKKALPNVRLIVVQRVDGQIRISDDDRDGLEEDFLQHYLWSMSREKIRQIVKQYIAAGSKLDEDTSTQIVIENLEALSSYRTPLNCITLLKIADHQIDAAPINRTEMIKRFLFILFTDFNLAPRYGIIPDLKDSLYALGYFRELLVRESRYWFEKKDSLR